MRILYLNTTYAGGGAEKVVRQIYKGMQQRGHEVYEIVCYNRRGNIDDPHVHVLYPNDLMKVVMRVQTYNRGNHNKTIPYAISYIRKFVKEHQIELIHLHNLHDNFLGIHDIAALTQLCPVIWTLHDLWALTGHCAFPYGCRGMEQGMYWLSAPGIISKTAKRQKWRTLEREEGCFYRKRLSFYSAISVDEGTGGAFLSERGVLSGNR